MIFINIPFYCETRKHYTFQEITLFYLKKSLCWDSNPDLANYPEIEHHADYNENL